MCKRKLRPQFILNKIFRMSWSRRRRRRTQKTIVSFFLSCRQKCINLFSFHFHFNILAGKKWKSFLSLPYQTIILISIYVMFLFSFPFSLFIISQPASKASISDWILELNTFHTLFSCLVYWTWLNFSLD